MDTECTELVSGDRGMGGMPKRQSQALSATDGTARKRVERVGDRRSGRANQNIERSSERSEREGERTYQMLVREKTEEVRGRRDRGRGRERVAH
jgi:hypothetical protein